MPSPEARPEGLKELTYNMVAMPTYPSGSSTILYRGGLEYLIFVGKSGLLNPLANAEYLASKTNGDSAWAINLKTNAVSEYENFNFTSVGGQYGGDSNGLYSLSGETDNSTEIDARLTTCALILGVDLLKRIPAVYVDVKGGPLSLVTLTDNTSSLESPLSYVVEATTKMKTTKVAPLSRGTKGKFWQFVISNVDGSIARVKSILPTVIKIPRRV